MSAVQSGVAEQVAQRIRREAFVGCGIVSGSLPVVSFGSTANATVATLGINPSVIEFQVKGVELDGQERRFETLGSLGVSTPATLTDFQVTQVVRRCNEYFLESANPYWRWFRPLELLLQLAVDKSYTNGSACHLDLVQWATDPVWRGLSPEVKARLIAEDAEFLQWQLTHESIRLVLMSGRQVINAVSSLGIQLTKVADLSHGRQRGELFRGTDGSTTFVGWNQTFPNGISNLRRDEIARLICDIANEVGVT